MKRWHYIGLDTHCHSTDLACLSEGGRVTTRWQGPTTIPSLVEAIEGIPRPRALTFEEGPLADWLYRNLSSHVDKIIVAHPRRNALIAKDSDKDDPIDAEKLAQLLRGGYLKAVHHPESLDRAIFKQHIGLYHQQVWQRVRQANHVLAQLRRWGVFVNEAAFAEGEGRKDLWKLLPKNPILQEDLSCLFASYDAAVEQESKMRRRLIQLARRENQIRRWTKLPGIQWIRGATLFAYLDTPWRFKSREALWRYMGIGLERHASGSGLGFVRVCQQANRHLKGAILGAAMSAIAAEDNPFAEQYRRWTAGEISPRNARRNVARSLAAVLWGMWKSGEAYRPERVGVPGVKYRSSSSSKGSLKDS
jgi:transposase